MNISTAKAVEDAKRVQASSLRECAAAGHDPPPYVLQELIGKGSFGRVYKATASNASKSPQVLSVKIISIEEGDGYQPGAADTFSDILKEVNTLKLLRNTGAKNINHIVDTLLVGQSVWMVTEYCAGGSVASLMRPTGGLPEKWIIPILREVAEAISWIHPQGIIHRDIKCANVLITEEGGVQLCDFGVAGIVASKVDKRSTVTGTLQWMAPELFDSTVSYSIEVDIWAFGAMAYEVASGLPPNATTAIDISEYGSYLKANCPRLEGDQYSIGLKDLVSFCMVEDPARRPPIDAVQKHTYLFNTTNEYPTSSLSELVRQYRLWEAQGGSRQSLFTAGGAQGPANSPSSDLDDNWTFGTQYDLSEVAAGEQRPDETVHQVSSTDDESQTQRPTPRTRQGRRRPPKMKELKVPLQKVFDPGTLSKYEDNVRDFYSRHGPPLASDLPFRDSDNTQQTSVRESLIDLNATLDGGALANVVNDETVKPQRRSDDTTALNRRTQDWVFPLLAPASANTGALSTRWAEDE
ncbi:hypothetical protein ACRALDRAFT_2095808, partial [Sodiomyces alcalophilus JCM 7366]|uniref:uncharacterized protein n=1 Tax=Sodiomyces alcalophilus JCM 7366 TaxID=591952 RepID=UPI0039B55F23